VSNKKAVCTHPTRFVPKVAGKALVLLSKVQYLSAQMLDFQAALREFIFHSRIFLYSA
jgi:hypothetical protein